MEQINEKAREIRERIIEKGIHISRIPKKTYEGFLSFADDDFCSDRGMALKFLWDFYNGIINTGIEHLEVASENLNQRLTAVEQLLSKPVEKKIRTTVSGQKRGS